MLLDQANTLVERITRYQTLKEQARHAQTFETRANQLKKSASDLSANVATMKALYGANIAVDFKFSSKDQVKARTQELREGFGSNPAFVDNPGFDLRFEYVAPLSGLADNIKEAAIKAWQKYVVERREQVSPEILSALRAVPEYRPIVATVQHCQEKIEGLTSSIPVDVSKALQQLASLTETQREAWLKLTGGELPNSVISFLRSSMGEGAELRQLTPEVVDWLQTRSLESAFRIKPRRVN